MLASGLYVPLLATALPPNPFTPLTAAALALALFIVAAYYMFSRLLGSAQLEAFAREEFTQFLFTILIFASFLLVYFAISGLASAAACGSASCDHFDVALYSLGLVENAMFNTYMSLYSAEFLIGIVSTMGFYVPVIVTPALFLWVSISSFAGIEPVSNALITLIESMGYLFGLAYARERLVFFFRDVTFAILVPLGFFMRALPFSRRTGSSIIAIAFAGFFAYPLSIVLSHQLIFGFTEAAGLGVQSPLPSPALCSYDAATVEEKNTGMGAEWEAVIGDLSTKQYDSSFFGVVTGIFWSTLGLVGSFLTQFLPAFASKYNFNLLSPTFSPFVHAAYFYMLGQVVSQARFAVFVLVTFVFEIIVTVTAFRSVSGLLGGEIEILGLTKVV
ncbi:MAG: hypothetical protein PHQ80_04605 [Candidatus ainarchaeum sp.]|nr:hypothetical protein [Candidatus ainarchaeum sp.]MDD5096655.1 hypothetical protein [Candidatus ainarchaeum sp.]